jgi:hypothetical protein
MLLKTRLWARSRIVSHKFRSGEGFGMPKNFIGRI